MDGTLVGKDETVYGKFGFLPTSVWYFHKTNSLQNYVDDELGQGSYSKQQGDVGGRNLSQFNPVVAEKIIKLWSAEGDHILDPFSGRCRALMAMLCNRRYTGYEISPKAYGQLVERIERQRLAAHTHIPTVINADSCMINDVEKYDLLFSCPPYWNVEDYNKEYGEELPGNLGSMDDYAMFMRSYNKIVANCYRALKPEKYAVWVVADIRRNKRLLPFHCDTIDLFENVGFKLHDVIINKIDSLSIMGIGAAIENGYTPKMHEYILVFKK